MTAYAYIAVDGQGKSRKGVIIADTEAHASKLLEGQGLFTTELNPKAERAKRVFGRKQLNSELRTVFTRQMAVLLAAGLPVDAALEAVRSSGDRSGMAALASRAKADLMDGQPLSTALENAQAGFPRYYIAAVRAGETAGNADLVFEELANHLENLGTDKTQISTALIYPGFVAAVSLLVCAILMTNVAPEIVAMFEISGRPLPPITQVVLGLSDWIGTHKWLLLGAGIGAILAIWAALSVPSIRARWHGVVLGIPMVGRFMRLGAAAQYLRTLALVVASKQAVLEATQSAAETLDIAGLRTQANEVSTAISQGQSLSQALGQLPIIPSVARQLIEAGEKSARLAVMAERSAVLVENTLSTERKRLAAVLEPMLMMIVGAGVLVIVLAVLLPIFDLQAVVTQ